MDLLAAEILARTGRDPGEHYRTLTEQFGDPAYERTDTQVSPPRKAALDAPGRPVPTRCAGQYRHSRS